MSIADCSRRVRTHGICRHDAVNKAIVVFLVTFGLPIAADAEATPERFSVATYNTRFLLDVFDDPYTNDEAHEPKTRHELESLGSAIRWIDADIIALQEIENEGTLKAMVVEHLPGMGYQQVAVVATNSSRGQNLGVLSRYPILSVTSYRHHGFGLPGDVRRWHFSRDLMCIRVRVSGVRDLHLFVVHLKSKRDSKGDVASADWRLAEAMAVRSIIGEVLCGDPDAWVLLVGDLNDVPESLPVQAVLGPPGQPILFDLHAHVPKAARITYLRGRYRSTIDYVLASAALAANSVREEASVLQMDNLLHGSDHAPVSAVFSIDMPCPLLGWPYTKMRGPE